jgi:FdhD protein
VNRCNIPIILSKSAPTNQAVRLARESGITLVGFARGDKMNIYSEEKRIIE